jgi:misacylated tRNA(Ala) deacylase
VNEAPVPTILLFENDAYRTTARARVIESSAKGLVLDQTIFYAESGGQPGDTGWVRTADGQAVRIVDTCYLPGKLRIVHIPERPVRLPPDEPVDLEIDWDRRYAHMRMHTCLHVFCGLVDAPVTGCSIHADRGRLDFDLPEATWSREVLEQHLREAIARDVPVTAEWYAGEEAARLIAARRTVKAPPATERIRLVRIGELDLQPCGGTHVSSLGELGDMRVKNLRKKSRHARRVCVEPA